MRLVRVDGIADSQGASHRIAMTAAGPPYQAARGLIHAGHVHCSQEMNEEERSPRAGLQPRLQSDDRCERCGMREARRSLLQWLGGAAGAQTGLAAGRLGRELGPPGTRRSH